MAVVARSLEAEFDVVGEEVVVKLGGVDVTADIRSELGSKGASSVAVLPRVRAALLERQREWARPPGLVADGRDMGTQVFPDSPLKIFLTASAKVRAERRFHQLQGQGQSVSLARLLSDIEERDRRDKSRRASPLVPAEDAVVVDSSELSPDAVLDTVLQLAADRKLVSETSE